MASKQPSKKLPIPSAKKAVANTYVKRAMDAGFKTKDPSSYVKPSMGPVGKIAASKTMPNKKAAPKKK